MPIEQQNKILIVDDDPSWHIIFDTAIKQINADINILTCETKEDAFNIIKTNRGKLLAVFTDNHLKGDSGAAGEEIALEAKKQNVPHIVICTGRPKEITPPEGIVLCSKDDMLKEKVLEKVKCLKRISEEIAKKKRDLTTIYIIIIE